MKVFRSNETDRKTIVACYYLDSLNIPELSCYSDLIPIQANCIGCSDGQIILSNYRTVPFQVSLLPLTGQVNNNTILGLDVGVYQVCITYNQSCVYCDSVTIDENITMGTNNLTKSIVYSYPNSFQSIFSIKGKGVLQENLSIRIFSPDGKEMLDDMFNNRLNIDASQWAPGIYLVKLSQNSEPDLIFRICKLQ